MASYKYKVIKGGKVIGEATTRAEAEAAAKKFGGHVAELLADEAQRKYVPDSKPAKTNPPLEPHSAATLLDAVKPGAPQQIHGVKVARVGAGYSVDGNAMTRAQALKALEAGRMANPKAKKAPAKSKPASRKASGRKIQYV